MESNQSYKTAYAAAYARLIEQYHPETARLFQDRFAGIFFGPLIRLLLSFKLTRLFLIFMYNIILPGMLGLQVCRTRYIDDALERAVSDENDQIIILGAGLDTRAYRFSENGKIRFYEVDLPVLHKKKLKRLQGKIIPFPKNVIFTPVDFNTQTLDEVFASGKIDFSKPVLFIWEGVTQYITEEAVKNTLNFISEASEGSRLIFTYIRKNIIDYTSDAPDAANLVNFLNMADQSWQFGLNPDEVAEFIKNYGLVLVEDISTGYYQENYLKPAGRKLKVSDIERTAFAELRKMT